MKTYSHKITVKTVRHIYLFDFKHVFICNILWEFFMSLFYLFWPLSIGFKTLMRTCKNVIYEIICYLRLNYGINTRHARQNEYKFATRCLSFLNGNLLCLFNFFFSVNLWLFILYVCTKQQVLPYYTDFTQAYHIKSLNH